MWGKAVEKPIFSVAEYNAPLDFILVLLQKHKLNILDIDISSLLEQYLAAIAAAQQTSLEVTSEFLEMASRLVYIKTISLLPRHKEEGDKLRQELSGQLIEYALCKAAAENLGAVYLGQEIFVREAEDVEIDPTYDLIHNAEILYAALMDAVGNGAKRLPPPREAFDPIIARPVVSVTTKIFLVLRTLRLGGPTRLESLYAKNADRSGLVATFLAVLELIRAGKISLSGQELRIS